MSRARGGVWSQIKIFSTEYPPRVPLLPRIHNIYVSRRSQKNILSRNVSQVLTSSFFTRHPVSIKKLSRWEDYHNFPRFSCAGTPKRFHHVHSNPLVLIVWTLSHHRAKSFHYPVADCKRHEIIAKINLQADRTALREWRRRGRRRRSRRRRRMETSERDLRDIHGREADYWEEGLVPHCVSRISLLHDIYRLGTAPNFFRLTATNVGIRREGHSPLM